MSSSGLSTKRKPKHHQPSVTPLRVLIYAASSIAPRRTGAPSRETAQRVPCGCD